MKQIILLEKPQGKVFSPNELANNHNSELIFHAQIPQIVDVPFELLKIIKK